MSTPVAEDAAQVAGGTRRRWEIAAALVLALVSIVIMVDSVRTGAGYTFSGPDAGFFPFWVSVPLFVTAMVALWQAVKMKSAKTLFESNDDIVELFKVGLPVVIALVAMVWIGFYLATAAYVAFFTAWYGRYRWYWVVLATVLTPLAFYLVFERAFIIALPKSIFYGPGFPI